MLGKCRIQAVAGLRRPARDGDAPDMANVKCSPIRSRPRRSTNQLPLWLWSGCCLQANMQRGRLRRPASVRCTDRCSVRRMAAGKREAKFVTALVSESMSCVLQSFGLRVRALGWEACGRCALSAVVIRRCGTPGAFGRQSDARPGFSYFVATPRRSGVSPPPCLRLRREIARLRRHRADPACHDICIV